MGSLGNFYDAAERFFSAIGGNHPLGRFAVGAGTTLLVMEALKPSWAYLEDGGRKNYGSGAEEFVEDFGIDAITQGTTKVPFWMPPLLVGFVAATFI